MTHMNQVLIYLLKEATKHKKKLMPAAANYRWVIYPLYTGNFDSEDLISPQGQIYSPGFFSPFLEHDLTPKIENFSCHFIQNWRKFTSYNTVK